MTAPRTLPWLAAILVIAALGFALSATGLLRPLQSVSQTIAEPLQLTVQRLTGPAADFVSTLGRAGQLRDENRDLRIENERLRSELADAREEGSRAGELIDLLGVSSQFSRDRLVFASVVAHDPSPLRSTIAINRGSRDGIEEGMVVLGKGGALIGTVTKVLGGTSWVRLLSDPASSVNALVQESRASALASGSVNRDLRMEFVQQGTAVKPGDTIVTSGLGGSYPPGLLIGKVASVQGNPVDMFLRVRVEAAVRLASVETVSVLTSFRPAPVEEATR